MTFSYELKEVNRNSMGKVFSGKAIWRRDQDDVVGSGVDTVDKQCEGEAEQEEGGLSTRAPPLATQYTPTAHCTGVVGLTALSLLESAQVRPGGRARQRLSIHSKEISA